MVTLASAAKAVGGTLLQESARDVTIMRVVVSSREAGPGSLFIAIPGTSRDGHEFLADARSNGCSGVVVSDPARVPEGLPAILVTDPRGAASRLAAHIYQEPSREMECIGVTGTNGKTTTNWLIYQLLKELRRKPLRIGTLGVESVVGLSEKESLTTPDPVTLHSLLRAARDRGGDACVMEVSSHALDQGRVDDVAFDVSIFTNLTRDHLDYHGTIDRYFDAKARLFALLSASSKQKRAAIISADDEYGRKLFEAVSHRGEDLYTFGRSPGARVRISDETYSVKGSSILLSADGKSYRLQTPFIGGHNAENAAAAFACGLSLGFAPDRLVAAFASMPQVPGRLERVEAGEVGVYVDYAHTPDALLKALQCVKPLTEGRLWVVFGCGGDRDRGKRSQMADVAARLADRVVVTSDNPRTEDPSRIIEDILSGPSGAAIRSSGIIEPDRKEAICKALSQAAPRDAILIAGKGHEDYQIIGKTKYHFSDQEVVREFISGCSA